MKGTILAFLAVALFSFYAVFGKILLENVNPIVILVFNNFLAAVILILVLDLIKRITDLRKISKKDFRAIILISVFSAVLGPLLFLIGLNVTSVTNAIFIGKSKAVMTSLLAIFFLKEKIKFKEIIGALIILLGIFVIVTQGFNLSMHLNVGDGIIFLSGFAYSIGNILFKKYVHHIPAEIIVTLRNLFGAIMLFIISFILADYSQISSMIGLRFILALLGLVILTTIIGQYLWYRSLDMTDAKNVALASMAAPLFSVFYATVFLHEILSSTQIIGGLIILVGVLIIELHFNKHHTGYVRGQTLKHKHWPHI